MKPVPPAPNAINNARVWVGTPFRFTAALGRAAGQNIRGRKLHVPPEILAARQAKCDVCPHLNGKRCGLCKCPLKPKLKWATERCPDNPPRWDKYAQPETPLH
jgi:hypothetical protein